MSALTVNKDEVIREYHEQQPPLDPLDMNVLQCSQKDMKRTRWRMKKASKRRQCPTWSLPVELYLVTLQPNYTSVRKDIHQGIGAESLGKAHLDYGTAHDELQNISVCLVGEKMWFLLAPWDAPPAQAGNAHANELREVTPRSHPHLPWVVVHQRAGHILLLPAGWFHYVLSHKEGSCCATFWLPAASKGMDNTQDDLASVDICNSPRIADGEFDAIFQTLDISPTQDALVNVPITTGACCPPQTR